MGRFGHWVAIVLPVNKKNILLTIWLLLPITIVSLLMVWIFISLDKDRLMDDAVPYGAGAGDTGNANAIGEWLAGNDADAISLAVKARREGVAIDPREWPGGLMVKIPVSAFGTQLSSNMFLVVIKQDGTLESIPMNIDEHEQHMILQLTQEQASQSQMYAGSGENFVIINGRFTDESDRTLKPIFIETQIPDPDLQVADPMVVVLKIDSVYRESP